MRLLGNLPYGLLFVISAPAGTGKTTLVGMLQKEYPQAVQRSISCTTRLPRKEERSGVDYYFLTDAEFDAHLQTGEFLESATLFGARYGTLCAEVEGIRQSGKHALLVIDTQGALAIRDKTDAILIFLTPPNEEELKRRLQGRQSESAAEITSRLAMAREELKMAKEYHYALINAELSLAYQTLKSIIIAEEHRIRR